MARVTRNDVARVAGVSPTTVSFVLNGRDDHGIAAATKVRVFAACEQLGYVPSGAARTLRRGSSDIVLCVLPSLPAAPAMEEFKESLSADLGVAGLTCLFEHAALTSAPLERILSHVQPDAVIRVGALEESERDALAKARIPHLDDVLGPQRADLSGLDQQRIGALQVQHLHALGHRHLGVARLTDPLEAAFTLPRAAGAVAAAAALGLPPVTVVDLDYTRDSAQCALNTLRDSKRPVTAVAAHNDLAALALLAATRTVGLSVPDDIALIGVDNLQLSSLTHPSLSTITIDICAIARRIAAALLQLLGTTPPWPTTPDVALTLVQRDSTTPPRTLGP
jgi:DNA-binding LacI/PurR family transcriptional regulator